MYQLDEITVLVHSSKSQHVLLQPFLKELGMLLPAFSIKVCFRSNSACGVKRGIGKFCKNLKGALVPFRSSQKTVYMNYNPLSVTAGELIVMTQTDDNNIKERLNNQNGMSPSA